MIIVYISVAIVLVFLVWYNTRNTELVRIKKGQVADFKFPMEVIGLPIITYYQGEKKYHFVFDSGSNISYVDSNSDITRLDKAGKDKVLNAGGTRNDATLADLYLYYNKHEYVCEVRVSDLTPAVQQVYNRCGIKISGMIGGDFLAKYNYCIDYKECKVYERK